MGKIGWLEGYLDIFEENAKKVILSPERMKTTKKTKPLWSDKNKKLAAESVLKLTGSLREIVSKNKTLEEAIGTTIILMDALYGMGWRRTHSKVEESERGRTVGTRKKMRQWALNVRNAIPETYTRPADKIRYLRAHREDRPLPLPAGITYIDSESEDGVERLVYKRSKRSRRKETLTVDAFRRGYLTKKIGK